MTSTPTPEPTSDLVRLFVAWEDRSGFRGTHIVTLPKEDCNGEHLLAITEAFVVTHASFALNELSITAPKPASSR
ncbi:MAG: hypothetical protein AAF959_05265 [Cyanobacteria bacterium P01_D01_bin.56]